MTLEFKDMDAFSRHIRRVVTVFPQYLKKGAHLIGEALEKSAKEKIGYQQPGAGPIAAWEPLAEATFADKERQGYLFKPDGNPLYRTGGLRDSISTVFHLFSQTLFLGSTSEIMVYHEFGTIHIPPRSILALTMYKAIHFIALALRYLILDWLLLKNLSREMPHGSL